MVSCSSIYFSITGISRKKAKINQKYFLSCLVGVEIIQKNDCTMPPLLHTANLLSSSIPVSKEPLG